MGTAKQSFGNRASRFILVITALAFGIRLISEGIMSPEKMILFLLLITIAAAIDSIWVKFIMALYALGYVLFDLVGHDINQFQTILTNALALLIVLFGLFVVFGGLRSRR